MIRTTIGLIVMAGFAASASAQSQLELDICSRTYGPQGTQIRRCADNPATMPRANQQWRTRAACEAQINQYYQQCVENARLRAEKAAARRRP